MDKYQVRRETLGTMLVTACVVGAVVLIGFIVESDGAFVSFL